MVVEANFCQEVMERDGDAVDFNWAGMQVPQLQQLGESITVENRERKKLRWAVGEVGNYRMANFYLDLSDTALEGISKLLS